MKTISTAVGLFFLLSSSLSAQISQESQNCVTCHEAISPGIAGQWRQSKHTQVKVGCFECHQAQKGDVDGFEHNGFFISSIVSPKDCSRCHEKEAREFQASHHSEAAKILGSLDNVLAEVVEGNMKRNSPSAVSGCWQCPGSEVKVLPGGGTRPGNVAQYGHGAAESGRLEGLVLGLPHAPQFQPGAGPDA